MISLEINIGKQRSHINIIIKIVQLLIIICEYVYRLATSHPMRQSGILKHQGAGAGSGTGPAAGA